jgi:hypothetical protein
VDAVATVIMKVKLAAKKKVVILGILDLAPHVHIQITVN